MDMTALETPPASILIVEDEAPVRAHAQFDAGHRRLRADDCL